MSGSLRPAEFVARSAGLGHRLRGIVQSFESSRAVHLDRIKKAFDLVAWPSGYLWTGVSYRLSRCRTVSGGPPVLRTPTATATLDIDDCPFSLRRAGQYPTTQETPLVHTPEPGEWGYRVRECEPDRGCGTNLGFFRSPEWGPFFNTKRLRSTTPSSSLAVGQFSCLCRQRHQAANSGFDRSE